MKIRFDQGNRLKILATYVKEETKENYNISDVYADPSM